MYIYLQAYRQGEAPANPLLAYVTFYLDGQKALETTAVESADAAPNRLKTMPLRFSVPLEKLAEGEYMCQVSVLASMAKRPCSGRHPSWWFDDSSAARRPMPL